MLTVTDNEVGLILRSYFDDDDDYEGECHDIKRKQKSNQNVCHCAHQKILVERAICIINWYIVVIFNDEICEGSIEDGRFFYALYII